MLFVFIAILVSVSLACGAFAPAAEPTATPFPTNPPPPTAAPLPTSDSQLPNPSGPSNPAGGNAGNSSQAGTSSDIVTVEDQNRLYLFDIPGDWSYISNELGNEIYSDVYMYADTWTSPDGSAVIEGISGVSQGFNFDGTTSTAVSLDLLNTYYSSTGKEGDIRISKTAIVEDGSTQFNWTSKGGGYSGISWFEVRGDKTFLMWTVNWGNDADQAILDILDNAINTYQAQTVP